MIGIFDSGLGGLTVLKSIKKNLPQYDYIYYGDTLHVPYGSRSSEAIYELSKKACDFLFEKGCKLIIVACNTASAKALRRLQTEYLNEVNGLTGQLVNILGVIRPVAEEFSMISKGRVGVIGTKGTIESGIYEEELKDEREKIKVEKSNVKSQMLNVYQQPTPLLVPFIEEGLMKRKELKSILRMYLRPLKDQQVDSLILGCTHYPLIIKQIRAIMGKNCVVPNPAEIVADKLKQYLEQHSDLEKSLAKTGQRQYFVTDLSDSFNQTATRFLKEKINFKKINEK
ncbi:glutamate racemase [Candidatus Falkowbacteria bacterium]|jgi:glutamate racemase|nr:glutamate racemase [Candidatus Falkowbacteria bacterium]MBT7006927.1 glutamate racemase [Candidatus Falkowbacteria bacterium]